MVILPREAQTVLLRLLDDTQTLISGDWENHDSPSPVECELDEFASIGVAYTGRRTLVGRGTLDAAAVTELWRTAGLEVKRTTIGSFDTRLGVDPHNRAFFSELQAGERATVLRGQSPRVPGNTRDELQRFKLEAGASG